MTSDLRIRLRQLGAVVAMEARRNLAGRQTLGLYVLIAVPLVPAVMLPVAERVPIEEIPGVSARLYQGIILTILIKLAFYPLSAASYKSMARMKVLAPKLQRLKERYGDDRQKMHQAMMELYKTEKINPLGGCLPIVVQIPVFIALYWVLLLSVELRHAPFIWWIKDLSAPDPFFILPVLMGATMFIQTWLNPTPPDPMQARLMKIMPVAFSVFFFFFPSGLVLYWLVNNILSIGQQWQITRALERSKAAHGAT